MAHKLLKRYPRTIIRGSTKVKQHFNYLLVLDFEATCQSNGLLTPQEIIEFPCMVVSTNDWKVKNVFHEYIKPRVHPTLTPFCIDLTGIIQDMVDNQPYFPEVFAKFCEWLDAHGYFKDQSKSAFVTCGDWDLRAMLPNQCALDGLNVPEYFKQWINLKQTYNDAVFYYPRSLKDMLLRLDIPLGKRLHSGINDTEHMVKIIQKLQQQHNALFKITSSLEDSKHSVNKPI